MSILIGQVKVSLTSAGLLITAPLLDHEINVNVVKSPVKDNEFAVSLVVHRQLQEVGSNA